MFVIGTAAVFALQAINISAFFRSPEVRTRFREQGRRLPAPCDQFRIIVRLGLLANLAVLIVYGYVIVTVALRAVVRTQAAWVAAFIVFIASERWFRLTHVSICGTLSYRNKIFPTKL